MDDTFSKSQIDRLGARLKEGEPSEADLRMLDAYRRSFMEPYEFVLGLVRNKLNLEPTGRPAKSTTAIREKLRRESIRLTQMQDIAGCRVVLGNLMDQDRIVSALSAELLNSDIVDRREHPSHGYRAVHVIVHIGGKSIEIQVRTTLQQLWAELSEKVANVVDPTVKYGGGPDITRTFLTELSDLVTLLEEDELEIAMVNSNLRSADELPGNLSNRMEILSNSNLELRIRLKDMITRYLD